MAASTCEMTSSTSEAAPVDALFVGLRGGEGEGVSALLTCQSGLGLAGVDKPEKREPCEVDFWLIWVFAGGSGGFTEADVEVTGPWMRASSRLVTGMSSSSRASSVRLRFPSTIGFADSPVARLSSDPSLWLLLIPLLPLMVFLLRLE